MKKKNYFNLFLFALFICFFNNNNSIRATESQINLYDGNLGYTYSDSSTTFMAWSSSASEIEVVVEGKETKKMSKDISNNAWIATIGGNLSGSEYYFNVKYEDGTVYENVLDPYGKYLNQDNTKNVVYNDSVMDLEGWDNIKGAIQTIDQSKIIYGVDLDTFTTHNTWYGTSSNKGKLLSLTQSLTTYNNVSTGFDHIKNLGITYVQLSDLIYENNPFVVNNKYVSGTYSYSGSLELRTVVNTYYNANIGIVSDFDFYKIANCFSNNLIKFDKEYYLTENGIFDLSKEMTKKYIEDVILYWVETYKFSGIKISNMSMFDYSYINKIVEKVLQVNPDILIYGDGNYTELAEMKAGENNALNMKNVSMINNSLNYALFGDLNNKDVKGILGGNYSTENIESLKFALLSSVDNGQIDYSLVKGISYKNYWGNESAFQIVNVLGSKEGLSIYDKLLINNITGNDLITKKGVLAFGTLMMSGGIPYIEAGDEFLASYRNFENTSNSICTEDGNVCFFNKSDKKIIDWSFAYDKKDTVSAFKSLVNFRKGDIEVVQTNTDVIKKRVKIYEGEAGVLGYIRNYPNAYVDETKNVLVLFNYSNDDYTINDYTQEGWKGLYNYNLSNIDGDVIKMMKNSIYISKQVRPPVVNQWVLLIIVVGVIGLLYYLNIYLNKKLVEKRGYDINDINKKYRPFISKNKRTKTEDNNDENNNSSGSE